MSNRMTDEILNKIKKHWEGYDAVYSNVPLKNLKEEDIWSLCVAPRESRCVCKRCYIIDFR